MLLFKNNGESKRYVKILFEILWKSDQYNKLSINIMWDISISKILLIPTKGISKIWIKLNNSRSLKNQQKFKKDYISYIK